VGHAAYIDKQEILVGTLYGKKLCEVYSNIWMDGLILKCMFEKKVTIVNGMNWHRIGTRSEMENLYGYRSLRNRRFIFFPPPLKQHACRILYLTFSMMDLGL
jgi:hypothetical protein